MQLLFAKPSVPKSMIDCQPVMVLEIQLVHSWFQPLEVDTFFHSTWASLGCTGTTLWIQPWTTAKHDDPEINSTQVDITICSTFCLCVGSQVKFCFLQIFFIFHTDVYFFAVNFFSQTFHKNILIPCCLSLYLHITRAQLQIQWHCLVQLPGFNSWWNFSKTAAVIVTELYNCTYCSDHKLTYITWIVQ